MIDTTVVNGQLVAEIGKYVQDETILNAFRQVPRHEFVPAFYDRLFPMKREWKLVSSLTDKDEWLQKVYTNRPLTISLNADNYPDSSSSQPNLMAQMIQSVQIHPGYHVLEIGTGTGYNAAIIASIVGPEYVVSVDINAALLNAARARIERVVGPGVRLFKVDGRNLPSTLKDFDAIIVTGSHDCIEPSWIEALAPGGRIIFNWLTTLTQVMIEAEKVDSILAGRICEYEGDFMGLHDGTGVKWEPLPSEPLPVLGEDRDCRSWIEDRDFAFFLQIHIPSFVHTYRNSKGEKSYSLKNMRNGQRVHLSETKVKGDSAFWEDIHRLHETFEHLHQPRRQAFSILADETGRMIFQYEENSFPIAI